MRAILTAILICPALLGGGSAAKRSEYVPFDAGEMVRYEVNYKPLFLTPAFKAGEVRIELNRPTEDPADPYQVSAWVQSAGLLFRLAGVKVRDYMESRMDAHSLASQTFLHQVRTNRKQEDIRVEMDAPARLARVVVTDVTSQPPRQLRSETFPDIPPDVADYLSIFYRLRADDLQIGSELQIPLSENGRVKQVTIRVLRSEEISTPLGRYSTLVIATQGGLFRGGGDFQAWFSLDQHRVPVKFEANVRFGKVYGHLVELRTPQMTRGLVRTP